VVMGALRRPRPRPPVPAHHGRRPQSPARVALASFPVPLKRPGQPGRLSLHTQGMTPATPPWRH
jgi:hypothetical protein